MVVTVAERNARKLAQTRSAISAILAELRDFAAAHGGSFIVFGSAARDELGPDSDLDIVVDFPEPTERAARDFAEDAAYRHGITPDLVLLGEVGPGLMLRVKRDGVRLP
jgi:predicted nucleotidyltransferase